MRLNKIGKVATKIRQEDGMTKVRYHDTDVVAFNDEKIILRNGGWYTATTKTRMNQTATVHELPFNVYQARNQWYVRIMQKDGGPKTVEYQEGMEIPNWRM